MDKTPEALVAETNRVLDDLWDGVRFANKSDLRSLQKDLLAMVGANKRVPKGFTRQNAAAFWMTCEVCEEMELFYGATDEADARAWVADHRKSCKLSR